MIIEKIIEGGSLQELDIMIREYGNILERKAKESGEYHFELGEIPKYPIVISGLRLKDIAYYPPRNSIFPPGYELKVSDPNTLEFTFYGNGEKRRGRNSGLQSPQQ